LFFSTTFYYKPSEVRFYYFYFLKSDDIKRVGRASKIVERMVNQNTFDVIAHGKSHY